MKRIWLWLLLPAAAWGLGLLPEKQPDVAELLPAQALVVSKDGGLYTLRTDNGLCGSGKSLASAFRRLSQNAPGTVFLGTVGHVIVSGRAEGSIEELAEGTWLRPAAKLYCAADFVPEASQAAEVLRAHPGELTLGQARAALRRGEAVSPGGILETEEGGVQLAG